jgi:hypothetical protein
MSTDQKETVAIAFVIAVADSSLHVGSVLFVFFVHW